MKALKSWMMKWRTDYCVKIIAENDFNDAHTALGLAYEAGAREMRERAARTADAFPEPFIARSIRHLGEEEVSPRG